MRNLIRSGFAVIALALALVGATASGFCQSVIEAPGYFTFEVSAVALPDNPADPNYQVLHEFAGGTVDRYTHYRGGYNSLAGAVRISLLNPAQLTPHYGRFQPYPGCYNVRFDVWNTRKDLVGYVRIADSTGEHQARPRPTTHTDIPGFADPDFTFDLSDCGSGAKIAFPEGMLTPETMAQWCAPDFLGALRPTPGIGIPYTAKEIAWHRGDHRSTFTTTFILARNAPQAPAGYAYQQRAGYYPR